MTVTKNKTHWNIGKGGLSLAVIVLLTAVSGFAAAENLPTAEEIVRASQANARLPGFESVSTLTITDGRGNQRVREVAVLSSYDPASDVERRLMRFLAPADVRGTGLLIYDNTETDDEMWIYLPTVRRARRMASSEKNGSFLGSEFTFADLTALSLTDFDYTVLERRIVRGEMCFIVEQRPKTNTLARDYGFGKRSLAVHAESYTLWEADYYDERGRHFKHLEAVSIVEVAPGRYRATAVTMENLQNRRASFMELLRYQTSPGIDNSYFGVPYLEQF